MNELNGLLGKLASRKLLVVTGKGGVGKSTLAATLGLSIARAGRRALLLEVDPRESLCPLLGIPPSGGQVVEALPGLLVQNLQPREVLDRLVRERLRIKAIAERVLASPVYDNFAEGAPGLKEVAVIAHALRLAGEGSRESAKVADVAVLDAPATGHGLSLLEAPSLVSEAIREGPVGQMGAELAGFVADETRCGAIVVTAAEEMPVQETIELLDAMSRRLARRPELIVVNGLYPDMASPEEPPVERVDPLLRLWHERRAVNDRQLQRLAEVWDGARVDLPLLPLDRGPDLLAGLKDLLESGLAGAVP